MFPMPEQITFALPEQIGNTDLFVGRKKEFDFFLGDWYDYLQKNFVLSQALLARRKKGKTAFLQRLFNIFWSQPQGNVVPFFFSLPEKKKTLASFSQDFFTAFAMQFLSYSTRDPKWLFSPLDFSKIRPHLTNSHFIDLYDSILHYQEANNWDAMWETASHAPFYIAIMLDTKVVQIFDEFQNIDAYVYDYRGQLIDSMSGSYL
ncbi:MAG TPA: hypothetical protein PLF96_14605, partial [Thermotogota bacterium]|nr:hypothetical protein [Thermotogota bacterium]